LLLLLLLYLSDALVPFEYINQLENVSATATNPGVHIYAAPVLFEQDNSGVPGIVRATDYMWSGLAAQNLNSWFGVGFPISNYRCVRSEWLLRGQGRWLSLLLGGWAWWVGR
jgi:hypothetical protein